jgi:hypothetical protein
MSNHKVDLATTVNITTTYAGQWASKYVSIALLSGKTLDNGGVTIMPNIDYKYVIQKGAFDANFIKNASCDFTDTGAVTLTERVLTLEEFQINSEFCKKDFSQTWQAAEMGYSVLNGNLPASFQEFIVTQFAAKVADKYEQVIWNGTNGNAGEFDGFTTLFAADGDVVDVAAVGGGVDAANVIAELQKIVAAIPATVYEKEDMHVYIGTDMLRFYIQALGLVGAGSGIDNKGTLWYNGVPLTIDGIKLFHSPGMPANTAVAAQSSNLYFGTGLLSDMNEIRIIDMQDIDGSQNVRFIMRWKAGIEYGIGSEVVLYA